MQSISILSLSTTANGAVSEKTFVGHGGATATAAGNTLGVAKFDAADTEGLTVDVLGTAIVTAGGAFSAGAELEVGSNGKAVVQSAGVTVARALQAATADGESVEVLLMQN